MRLIDLDAFREEFDLREHCEDCGRHNKKECDYPSYSAQDFCGWLDDVPTIDAVPVRHGRWEYIPGDGKFRAILICSRCRRNVGEYNRFNYCPHCGAKMDLEETK